MHAINAVNRPRARLCNSAIQQFNNNNNVTPPFREQKFYNGTNYGIYTGCPRGKLKLKQKWQSITISLFVSNLLFALINICIKKINTRRAIKE